MSSRTPEKVDYTAISPSKSSSDPKSSVADQAITVKNSEVPSEIEEAPASKATGPSNVKIIGVAAAGLLVGAAITLGVAYATLGTSHESHAEVHEDHVAQEIHWTDDDGADVVDTYKSKDHVENYCHGTKPKAAAFDNYECVSGAVEQAGGNVTKGFVGSLAHNADPIVTTLKDQGLCPVNVHWHLGAEHLSVGEYDESGKGPADQDVGNGGQCYHFDAEDERFTKEYDWKYCEKTHVGQTYEVHWPHSNMGACNTPLQYQTPFYDGVFCNMKGGANPDGDILLDLSDAQNVANQVGVQSQVFTIVNDEDYYEPNLFRGMLIKTLQNQTMGREITAYTGSTTGITRSNEVCSKYSPITWHVDRKCHMISASSFDKLCKDMMTQLDDMSDDVHPHGAREVVDHTINADNQQEINVYVNAQ